MGRFRFRASRLRGGAALVAVAGAGVAVSTYGPTWLAYAGGIVVTTLVGLLVLQHGPAVIEKVSGTEPLRAVVGADAAVHNDGWRVLLPVDADHTGPVGERRASLVRTWFSEQGAYDAGTSFVRLALEGRSADTVLVKAIRARVLIQSSPISGDLVTFPGAGEGNVTPGLINLDDPSPEMRTEEGTPYFAGHWLSLGKGEVHVFALAITSSKWACEWELEVELSLRGNTQTIVLSDGDTPFRTSALDNVQSRFVWSWFDQDPQLIPEPAPDSPS